MSNPLTAPARVNLTHATPRWVKSGATFFITGCCGLRGTNQLCLPEKGPLLLEAAQFYHTRHDWFCAIFLLMPDHFHALVAPAPDKSIGRLLGDWKRFTTSRLGIVWQKNFIDHRLRSDESWVEKANYIRLNPIRAGLIRDGEAWPYVIEN